MGLIVVGASTLGTDAIAIARDQGRLDIVGVVDDRPLATSSIDGVPLLGSISVLRSMLKRVEQLEIVVAIGDSQVRSRVHERIVRDLPDIRLAKLIHPRATLLGSASIDDGCIIFPGVVLGPGSSLGRSTVVNANATVGAGARLKEFVSLGPGANIGSDSALGKGVYVGMGAAIAQQVSVGDWCTVGALSFVRRNAPSGALVVGIPGRIVERRT